MKILTFNIRCDYNQDHGNSFQYRKPLIVEKMMKEKPDIVCFQEVLPHVAEWLKATFTDYYMIGICRSEDFKDEQATIAYKKDLFNLMEFKTFWLSKNPNTPGSRYDIQSPCPRTCAVATFQIINTTTLFRVYNTHLDHESTSARLLGLSQIHANMVKDNESNYLPSLFLGDFNATPESEEITVFNKISGMKDLTDSINVTFHDYGNKEHYSKIDYIYASDDIQCTDVKAWTDSKDNVYLSDHYPVSVDVNFI